MSGSGAAAAHRFRVVRRRWPAFAWDADGRSRRSWNERQWGYVLAVASLFAVSYLDVNLLARRAEAWWPSSLLHETQVGRVVLFVLLALDGLALAALASWAHIGAPRRLGQRLRSQLGRGWLLISWVVAGIIVPFLASLSWLVSSTTDPSLRRLAIAVSIAFHLLLMEATRRHVASLARTERGWRGVFLRVGPMLALLPAPAALLGVAVWLPWARENRDEKTLAHAAFARRGRRSFSSSGVFSVRATPSSRRSSSSPSGSLRC